MVISVSDVSGLPEQAAKMRKMEGIAIFVRMFCFFLENTNLFLFLVIIYSVGWMG
jgi:hypothetical protein